MNFNHNIVIQLFAKYEIREYIIIFMRISNQLFLLGKKQLFETVLLIKMFIYKTDTDW